MMKLYMEYGGVKYYDYDVYLQNADHIKSAYLIDENTLKTLKKTISSMKDNTFRPNKGDELCVIPDCKYNLEDIRKNYKIKRGYDNGVCNVFSENSVDKISYRRTFMVALIPSVKAAVLNYYSREDEILEAIGSLFPTVNPKDKNEVIFVKPEGRDYTLLYAANIGEVYFKLLNGELKKPCINVDSLDLNTGEEVTLDSLLIVHKLSMESAFTEQGWYKTDWDENLKIQLAALNNLDWRKYPGTIDMLMNGFEWERTSSIIEMKERSSRYPKNVRNILNFSSDKFASKEDLDLSCRFIRSLLKMEDVQFTNLKDLWDRLEEQCVKPETFLNLFDNMVRLKDKEWKDE